MFQTLHQLFEQQYTELEAAVDVIAERTRALGQPAPGTYSDFVKLTSIKEVTGVPYNEMIRLQLKANETVVRTARSIIAGVGKVDDEASADLLAQRIQLHEKTSLMLRSMLEE